MLADPKKKQIYGISPALASLQSQALGQHVPQLPHCWHSCCADQYGEEGLQAEAQGGSARGGYQYRRAEDIFSEVAFLIMLWQ